MLHLLGALRPSGMERMLVSAAPHWDTRLRHTLIGQGDIHPFRDTLESAGYRVLSIPSLRTRAGGHGLRQVIAAERPDVVHIHSEGASLRSALSARHTALVMRTVHNVFPVRGRASWSRRAQAALGDSHVGKFVAPSPDVAENERRIGRDPEVIYNWIADEFFTTEVSQGIGDYAVIVGNASPIKNQALALRALVELGIPVAHVGDLGRASGEEIALLRALESRGLLLHSGPGDPIEWLPEAGAYLMPSRHEGMGVALAEALALGIPALVGDTPGLRWARALPGVSSLALEVAEWIEAIPRAFALGRDPQREHPDFSARRGAREYGALYLT